MNRCGDLHYVPLLPDLVLIKHPGQRRGDEPRMDCFALSQHAKKYLRPDKIDDLKQKFPRTNYQSTAEWAKAIETEILSVLLPAKGYPAGELEQAVREWRADQQVAGSITYARELLEYELKETERLNAMIVKQTRHCAELKAWEEAEEMRSKK
jgi:hypothetical protein